MIRTTLLAFTLGIAALTGPASAGGPVIAPEEIEGVAEAPPRSSNKALPWLIGGGIVLLAIIMSGDSPCNGDEQPTEPGCQ